MDAKQMAQQTFHEVQAIVALKRDFDSSDFLRGLIALGGIEAVGIDRRELEALFRQNALNSLPRLLGIAENIEPDAMFAGSYSREFQRKVEQAIILAGGYDAVIESGVSRERILALPKKAYPFTPSICGDE